MLTKNPSLGEAVTKICDWQNLLLELIPRGAGAHLHSRNSSTSVEFSAQDNELHLSRLISPKNNSIPEEIEESVDEDCITPITNLVTEVISKIIFSRFEFDRRSWKLVEECSIFIWLLYDKSKGVNIIRKILKNILIIVKESVTLNLSMTTTKLVN